MQYIDDFSTKVNQFNYNRLHNEKEIQFGTKFPQRSQSYSELGSKDKFSDKENFGKEAVLIDLSDEINVKSTEAQSIMTQIHNSWHEKTDDEPIYMNEVKNAIYENWNPQQSKYYDPPCEGITNVERYYSTVTNEESLNKITQAFDQQQDIKKEKAFDWLDMEFNQIRVGKNADQPIKPLSNEFNAKNDNNSATTFKLDKKFIEELESKIVTPKKFQTKSLTNTPINSNNLMQNTSEIPCIDPPPKTIRRNNNEKGTPLNTANTKVLGNSLITNNINSTNIMTTLQPNSVQKKIVPVNMVQPQPTAPSRESVYGLGFANSIPGSSGPSIDNKSLVGRLQSKVKGASLEECRNALFNHNFDLVEAFKSLQLGQLSKLNIASQEKCFKALVDSKWDTEIAASRLLDNL